MTSVDPIGLRSRVDGHNFSYLRCGDAIQVFDSNGAQLTRHPDLFFQDGSLIIQAETMLFKIHWSQLARHSELFRDVFSLPQPPNDRPRGPSVGPVDVAEDCENCPVVILHDSAEDVASFLAALYDGCTFGNNGREDFAVVAGILRLSTKYLVDHLRDKALAHLSIAWPSTLRGWDAREEIARAFELQTSTSGGHFYPSPITVINLAREVNAPQLLPSAFYDLARYTYAQIYEPAPDEPLYQLPGTASLSPLDMQRLSLGKEAAQVAITTLIQSMGHAQTAQRQTHAHFRKNSTGLICLSAAACRKDFAELTQLATSHYIFDRERGQSDPLYVSEEVGQLKSAELSECKACARSLERWAAAERAKIWHMINVWFRLELPVDRPSSPASPTQ
uniref:BTB domain-containing protein n=1 Tax=Mycena chlorophos TaxID=658473 RepID=A0ABQ0LAW4_MYCCL|nr:predicted protein [Mycena chlorophos]